MNKYTRDFLNSRKWVHAKMSTPGMLYFYDAILNHIFLTLFQRLEYQEKLQSETKKLNDMETEQTRKYVLRWTSTA